MKIRTKRPNEFRCLIGAVYGLLAIVLAVFLNQLNSALCGLLTVRIQVQQCVVIPTDLLNALYWVAAAGLVFTCYRIYRDFYVGDYYFDLLKSMV